MSNDDGDGRYDIFVESLISSNLFNFILKLQLDVIDKQNPYSQLLATMSSSPAQPCDPQAMSITCGVSKLNYIAGGAADLSTAGQATCIEGIYFLLSALSLYSELGI